jgi:hypothetical protein
MDTFTRRETQLLFKSLALLTLVAMFSPLPLFGQPDIYNFGAVTSVPATGTGCYLNIQYTVLELPKNPTSSGPFSCVWPNGIGDGQCGSVGITFNPSAAGTYSGNCSIQYWDESQWVTTTMTLSGTYFATNVFDPAYQLVSIIYDAPGNKSSDGYTDTTTDGTTTTIGNSFTYGQNITFNEGIKAFGSGGGASESFGVSDTTFSSTAFQETFTDGTGVANASQSFNPDAINHNLDLFLIWLNPQVTVVGIPPTPSDYSVGVQPTANGETPLPDIVEVPAIVMEPNAAGITTVPPGTLNRQLDPETGQYTPGLAAICKNLITSEYNAGTCTLADQCGCTPADFAPILQQDPLLYYNGLSKPISPYPNTASPLLADTSGESACGTLPTNSSDKCRYVPVPSAPGSTIPETTTLAGPSCVGCNNNPNTFQQGENQSTTKTLGESTTETVKFSVKGGTPLFSVTEEYSWSWTQSESTGTTTGTGVQLTVTLNSATVGCEQSIPVYEDTVYHTFVFQQPAGAPGATCTTATATPTFSPAAGTYTEAQTVTISSATTGATIYYTTNGTTPTTSSTQYKGPVIVSKTETLKAISYFPGWATSSVGSASYTIE